MTGGADFRGTKRLPFARDKKNRISRSVFTAFAPSRLRNGERDLAAERD